MGWNLFSSVVSGITSGVKAVASGVAKVAVAVVETVVKIVEVPFKSSYKEELEEAKKKREEQKRAHEEETREIEAENQKRVRKLNEEVEDAARKLRDLKELNERRLREQQESTEKMKAENAENLKNLKKRHQAEVAKMESRSEKDKKELEENFEKELEKIRRDGDAEIDRKTKQNAEELKKIIEDAKVAEKSQEALIQERLAATEEHEAKMKKMAEENAKRALAEKERIHELRMKNMEAHKQHILQSTDKQIAAIQENVQRLSCYQQNRWAIGLINEFQGEVSRAILTASQTLAELTNGLEDLEPGDKFEDGDEESDELLIAKDLANTYKKVSSDAERKIRNFRKQMNDFPGVDEQLKLDLDTTIKDFDQFQRAASRLPLKLDIALKKKDAKAICDLRQSLNQHKEALNSVIYDIQLVSIHDNATLRQLTNG